MRRFVPGLWVLLALAAIWWTTRAATRSALGPSGFLVERHSANRRLATRERAPALLAPDVIAPVSEGGTLDGSGIFLAAASGRHAFYLGSTGPVTLRIDGREQFNGTPSRAQSIDVDLTAGLHEIAVHVERGDSEGGLVLAVRPPGENWHAHLIAEGEVLALSLREAQSRLGPHAAIWIVASRAAPWCAVAIAALLAWVAAGARRRSEVRRWAEAVAADDAGRGLAVGLVAAVLLALFLEPLLDPGYYACHEEESYLVRLHQFISAVRAGVPLGRWWPDPIRGRGLPFLCLYAPLLYLLSGPLVLAGASAIVALKAISALTVLAGAWAIYRLARRHFDRSPALLAVALFTLAPYLHNDLFVRADLAETLVFATFPLTLWALDCAIEPRGTPAMTAVGWLAIAVAALGTSHNITGYFAVYFIGLAVALNAACGRIDRAAFARVIAGGLLGAAMVAFFAVPALLDRSRVWIERITGGYYDYRRNAVPFAQLFVAPRRWDMRLDLGAPLALAVLLGLALPWIARRRLDRGPRALRLIGVVGALWAIALVSPMGRGLFKILPLGSFVGFPWRLLLFASCLGALSGAAALAALPTGRLRIGLFTVALLALVAAELPQAPPAAPLLRKHTHFVAELQGLDTDYVTSMNEYEPRTVRREAGPFDLVAQVVPPAGGTILERFRAPGHYRVRARASAPSIVELNAHWFPGWRAAVDGQPIAIGPEGATPFDDDGLIRVPITPGDHVVEAIYSRTTLRAVCDGLSLVALLAALSLVVVGYRRRRA